MGKASLKNDAENLIEVSQLEEPQDVVSFLHMTGSVQRVYHEPQIKVGTPEGFGILWQSEHLKEYTR